MKILQTIWAALTIENEVLINYFSIPMTLLEATVTTLLFTSVLNITATRKQKVLYILSFSLIGMLSMRLIPAPYYTFVNIISCILLVYFIFKTTILKSILVQVVSYIPFLILVPITLKIYTLSFNVGTSAFTSIPLYKITYSLTLYLAIYLIYRLLSKFDINIELINFTKLKHNYKLLITFIIGVIALAIQGYLVNVYSDFIPLWLNLLSIGMSIIYFLISIYSLFRTNKLEITAQDLEEEKLYNKTLTILYDNIRGFKHDFNNIVQSIEGYIANNNMEGLKEFHSDLMKDCQKLNNLAILNPELINNPAIYSILTSKYHRAESLGIKMTLEVFLDLKTLNIKTYDLTRILGVLLDNAIEASNQSKEKEIFVTIRKDDKLNRQLFIIENTYSNKEVDTDRIFEKGYTSKKEENNKSHGLGLWNVRKIIKKNNNLNLFTTKNNKLFKQQLEIYS